MVRFASSHYRIVDIAERLDCLHSFMYHDREEEKITEPFFLTLLSFSIIFNGNRSHEKTQAAQAYHTALASLLPSPQLPCVSLRMCTSATAPFLFYFFLVLDILFIFPNCTLKINKQTLKNVTFLSIDLERLTSKCYLPTTMWLLQNAQSWCELWWTTKLNSLTSLKKYNTK